MKRADWTVSASAVRPVGKPGECTYCRVAIGQQHAESCALRKRTVVIRTTIEHVITVPESWDARAIEFHRNESNVCGNNLADEVGQLVERVQAAGGCICGLANDTFVREATEDDENDCVMRIAAAES